MTKQPLHQLTMPITQKQTNLNKNNNDDNNNNYYYNSLNYNYM